MSAPTFRGLFAAHMPPRREPVTVEGCPHEAWIEFRSLNQARLEEYFSLGTELKTDADGRIRGEVRADPAGLQRATRFLVGHTVRDFSLWTPGRAVDDGATVWTQLTPQAKSHQDRAAVVAEILLDALPEFWAWLVEECQRQNGLLEEQAGN